MKKPRLKARGLVAWIFLMHMIMFALYSAIPPENFTDNDINSVVPFSVDTSPRNYSVTSSGQSAHDVNKDVGTNVTGSQRFRIISSCTTNMTFPFDLSEREGWLPVNDGNNVYVFSAYHDARDVSKVSIIGIKIGPGELRSLVCQIWKRSPNGNNVTFTEIPAKTTNLPDAPNHKYMGTVITCTISRDVPDFVSLVIKKCTTPRNLLPVKRRQAGPYSKKFAVCLTPLHFQYAKAYEFVEWIELNRILGAEFFTLYNYSISPNVRRVIDYYKNRGLVEIVNWDLPIGVDTWPVQQNHTVQIHYFGQITAMNECWRRNLQRSEYLVYTDLDEFIVPRKKDSSSWKDLIKLYPSAKALVFRNVFFRKEWDASDISFKGIGDARKFKLTSLLKTVRETTIFPNGVRSKYMVRSDSAKLLAIHSIPNLQAGFPKRVATEDGLLHHYRNLEQYEDDKSREPDNTVVDKYSTRLVDNVRKVWSELSDVDIDVTSL